MSSFLAHTATIYPDIVIYARSLTSEPEAADEAVHATLLRCTETKGDEPMTLEDARRYWFTAVRNALRPSRQAAKPQLLDPADIQLADPAEPGEALADRLAHETALEALLLELERAIDQLPIGQRDVLLRYASGQRPRSIAAELDLPEQTLFWRLRQARRTLRARFEATYQQLLADAPSGPIMPAVARLIGYEED